MEKGVNSKHPDWILGFFLMYVTDERLGGAASTSLASYVRMESIINKTIHLMLICFLAAVQFRTRAVRTALAGMN